MAILKLQNNVPAVIALQFATGKIAESTIPNAPSQVMFTLCDGRKLFVPLSVADSIRAAGIQAGSDFEILKASAHDYRIRFLGEAVAAQTAPAPNYTSNYTGSQHNAAPPPAQSNGHHAPPPAPPPVQPAAPPVAPAALKTSPAAACMMAAMCSAVDAILETQAYATRRGLGLTFSEESVRAIGLSIYIDQCRNGGAR